MHNRLRFLAAMLLLWLGVSTACAGGIDVGKAEVRLTDDGYQLTADFNISLNFVVEQALTHGMPLYFTSEFTLTRPRWYWLDEVVAHDEQTTKLSYNILTRQYRITRGTLFQNFESLDDALHVFGHQSFAPIPFALLKKDVDHIVAVRMRLDVTQLPKPLQVNALATSDWDLDSGWFRWTVRPGVPAGNAGGKRE